jgi:hypothetical protein
MRTDRAFLAAALALACALPAVAQVSVDPDEFTVAENHGSKAHAPAVALVQNGSLVLWEDEFQGVLARRFDNSGSPRAATVVLAANDPLPPLPFSGRILHEMREPALAARADGSFLAVWSDLKLNRSADIFYQPPPLVVASQVYARLFGSDGRPLSRAVLLSGVDAVAGRPQAVANGDGFLVTWQEKGGADAGAHLRSIDRDGTPGTDVLVAPRATRPSLALGGNGVLVTFERSSSKTQVQVFGRLYTRNGAPAGEAFRIAGEPSRAAGASAVAGQPGGFLVVYTRLQPNSTRRTAVYGQLVSKLGQLTGGELQISHGFGESHSAPVLASLADGGWIVDWLSWDGGFAVAQSAGVLTPAANAVGNPLFLNEGPIHARAGALASSPDGRLLAVWEGFGPNSLPGLRGRGLRGPQKK